MITITFQPNKGFWKFALLTPEGKQDDGRFNLKITKNDNKEQSNIMMDELDAYNTVRSFLPDLSQRHIGYIKNILNGMTEHGCGKK